MPCFSTSEYLTLPKVLKVPDTVTPKANLMSTKQEKRLTELSEDVLKMTSPCNLEAVRRGRCAMGEGILLGRLPAQSMAHMISSRLLLAFCPEDQLRD